MKRTRLSKLRGVVERQAEAIGLVEDAGDYALVERGTLRALIMRCPEGCGEILTINLDRRAGKAWQLYLGKTGATLYPSVWRDTGCEAHFIMWDDVIQWTDERWRPARDERLETHIRGRLTSEFQHFVNFQDADGSVPWAILEACRALVREGLAEEGVAGQRSYFRLAQQGRKLPRYA